MPHILHLLWSDIRNDGWFLKEISNKESATPARTMRLCGRGQPTHHAAREIYSFPFWEREDFLRPAAVQPFSTSNFMYELKFGYAENLQTLRMAKLVCFHHDAGNQILPGSVPRTAQPVTSHLALYDGSA